MKKVFSIISIVFIVVFILFVLAWIWVSGLKKDQKATKKEMKIILENYDNFNNRVEEFSLLRNNFYEYREDLFLETLSEKAADWNSFMENYAGAIKEVDKASEKLKKRCDIKYGDVNTNSKCTAFKANYEAAMNYYISDVKAYNVLIDEYDKWNSENGGKYSTVNKGSFPVYKDYIDYDGDGESFGKEEVVKNEK